MLKTHFFQVAIVLSHDKLDLWKILVTSFIILSCRGRWVFEYVILLNRWLYRLSYWVNGWCRRLYLIRYRLSVMNLSLLVSSSLHLVALKLLLILHIRVLIILPLMLIIFSRLFFKLHALLIMHLSFISVAHSWLIDASELLLSITVDILDVIRVWDLRFTQIHLIVTLGLGFKVMVAFV